MIKLEQKPEESILVAGAHNSSSSGSGSGMARRGTDRKNEVRAKTFRFNQEIYDRLKKRGEFGIDFDVVVTRVLESLEKCEKEHQASSSKEQWHG